MSEGRGPDPPDPPPGSATGVMQAARWQVGREVAGSGIAGREGGARLHMAGRQVRDYWQ